MKKQFSMRRTLVAVADVGRVVDGLVQEEHEIRSILKVKTTLRESDLGGTADAKEC